MSFDPVMYALCKGGGLPVVTVSEASAGVILDSGLAALTAEESAAFQEAASVGSPIIANIAGMIQVVCDYLGGFYTGFIYIPYDEAAQMAVFVFERGADGWTGRAMFTV